MRLIIIPIDGAVNKDGKVFIGLDLTPCNIPTDVHALQWEEQEPNKGHIEFKSSLVQNEDITELPAWANACVEAWNQWIPYVPPPTPPVDPTIPVTEI